MDRFDLIVIGGGPGGYVAALEAAKLGKTVALAESREVGGTCLNRGCIPTKALLRASRVYREANHSTELGIITDGVSYDFSAMHSHLGEVTGQLRSGIEALLKRAKVTLLCGKATILSPTTVQVNGTDYETDNIIIATGSNPAAPPIPGSKLPGVVNSDGLLENGGVDCKRLIIIGGGVIGVEFAQVYNDLGASVPILEAMPRLLPPLDREFAQNLGIIFKKRGIEIHTGAMVTEIAESADGLICHYTEKDTPCQAVADCVLVCTGRTPNTAGLCAEGVELHMQRGYIPVDENGKTAVDGIYAIGDVVLGGIQLAHAAEATGRNAVHAICGKPSAKVMSVVPSCVFTEPEIASAGITADEAKAAGIGVTVVKNLTSANGKSVIEGADRGFSKLIFAAEGGQLLGAQLMCSHASEMIGGLTAAINSGLTAEQLESTIFPHPTVSETIIG
ncbi:MAG: dihydrolipoyl dehydrogenase [Angelakisella sp.]